MDDLRGVLSMIVSKQMVQDFPAPFVALSFTGRNYHLHSPYRSTTFRESTRGSYSQEQSLEWKLASYVSSNIRLLHFGRGVILYESYNTLVLS